jgi:hypothetical protein
MLQLVTFLVVLASLWWSASKAAEGTTDYCAKNGALIVLLLDITTPYDEADKTEIVEAVNEAYRVLEGGDKLVVRTIADSYAHSERLFDRCKPYCATSSTIGRYFNCNDGVIRSDADNDKYEMTQALKMHLAHFEERKYSDIIRTLVTTAREEIKGANHVRIIIFSDLIENSDHLSGGQLFNLPTARLLANLKQEGLIAALSGAQVQVAGVGRAGTPERRPLTVRELNKLDEFWKAYFAAAGATVEMSQHLIHGPQ